MNDKRMISAFSIMETIVGMAITAIIMSIIFVVFSIVTERMMDYKSQNELICDLNRLTYSINKDIFENEKMTFFDNEITFKSYTGENIKYSFQEDYMLRNNEIFIDTFKIKLKQLTIDTLKNKSEQFVFQRLKLNIEVNENKMDLKFYKRIYANELLKKFKD
ncbi:hypothetical protein [Flavobacterium aestivum]|uniref:hypothetical protein n=1 Tax=Flavobacterium aestivum TaxID=3003257 RepID=UPI002482EA69|nr:hypothetical protein [Flavobacterium aestivum]